MMGWGSFMQAVRLCVLVRVWVGGEVGNVGPVWALRKDILLAIPGRCFFCGSFMFFSVLCLLCLCARLFVCALWSPAGGGGGGGWPLGSRLWCLLWVCWYPGSGVVLDCIDS